MRAFDLRRSFGRTLNLKRPTQLIDYTQPHDAAPLIRAHARRRRPFDPSSAQLEPPQSSGPCERARRRRKIYVAPENAPQVISSVSDREYGVPRVSDIIPSD